MSQSTTWRRWIPAVAIALVCTGTALGQGSPTFTTTVPGTVMDQFRSQRITWTTNVWLYARSLFGLLAVIEFAWSAAVMLLEKSDLQSWTSALLRKMMWIGAFYGLLLYGNVWIPAIIDSFTAIGQNASGVYALSPAVIFAQGLSTAGALMDGASTSAFFTNPGTSLALVFCALLIVISYVVITINFIVTMVESYMLVSVGFIFLGFGGSRWTAPFVERYIGLAVSIGIKILLLYCLIAAGMSLGVGWLDEAQKIGASSRPLMTAFNVMGAAVIFMMLCWQIPKLFAGVLGGAPALTGGDFVATGTLLAGTALAAGATLAGGASALIGVGALGSRAFASGAGTSGSSTVSAVASVFGPGTAGGGVVLPPPTPSGGPSPSGISPGTRIQPDPPTSDPGAAYVAAVGGEPLAGSGFENEQPARGFSPPRAASDQPGVQQAQSSSGPGRMERIAGAAERVQSSLSRAAGRGWSARRRLGRWPSDAAPLTSPPRMPIDHHE